MTLLLGSHLPVMGMDRMMGMIFLFKAGHIFPPPHSSVVTHTSFRVTMHRGVMRYCLPSCCLRPGLPPGDLHFIERVSVCGEESQVLSKVNCRIGNLLGHHGRPGVCNGEEGGEALRGVVSPRNILSLKLVTCTLLGPFMAVGYIRFPITRTVQTQR